VVKKFLALFAIIILLDSVLVAGLLMSLQELNSLKIQISELKNQATKAINRTEILTLIVENLNNTALHLTQAFQNKSMREEERALTEQLYNYIIYSDGTIIYAKNGRTGQIEFSGTDSSTVIQSAINALLGKWGTVWIKGFITLTRGITLWTGIGLRGAKPGWGDTTGQLRIERAR
jgi:regulator of replication initiation timing